MEEEARQVAQAVQQLLSHAHSAEQQRAADCWLNEYSQQSSAWQTSLLLLEHPQAEVAYFASNILLAKVRREWSELDAGAQAAVQAGLSAALQARSGQPSLLLRRLVLLLAAVAARSAPAAAAQLAAQALEAPPELALELLAALAEEAEGAAGSRRAALLHALRPATDSLLALAERSAASQTCAALRATHYWLRLTESPGAHGLALPPPALARRAPGLLSAALRALGQDGPEAEAGCELLAALQGGGGCAAAGAAEEAAAAEAAVAGLCALRAAVEAEEGEGVAVLVARVATALAERAPAAAAAGGGGWLALAELVCACARRPEPACLEACLDYFLALAGSPAAQRHPRLREPLCEHLFALCLRAARLPPDWTAWPADAAAEAACGVDVDALQRFREQTLAELAESSCALLRPPWLARALAPPLGLGAVAEGGWREAEAALAALRWGGAALGRLALGDADGAEGERAACNALLAAVFGALADPGRSAALLRGPHACCLQAACRLAQQQAAWLGRAPAAQPLLPGLARLLLSALRAPGCAQAAAEALRGLCARAGAALAEPAALAWLIEAAHATLPPPPPPGGEDARAPVLEGLARLVARTPAGAAQAARALTQPLLARAAAAAEAAAPEALAAELALLAGAIRFMEAGEGGGEPPALAALAAAWPVLSALGAQPPIAASPPVMAALSDVYARAFGAGRAAAAPLLPAALQLLLPAFERHAHAGCCDALAAAVEALAPAAAPGAPPPAAGAEEAALGDALARCAAALQARAAAGCAPPDALRALCELAQRCALFLPRALLRAEALRPLLACAAAAVACAEREPCAAAAKLLQLLLAPGRQMAAWGGAWGEARPRLLAQLAGPEQAARRLAAALLAAGCGGAPRGALAALGGALHALLAAGGGAGGEWVREALRALPAGALGEAERAAALAVATRAPPLSQQRFEAFFVDLACICRREQTADALLAYQMD